MSDTIAKVIRMSLEYDGSAYAGWQRQANSPTVQQSVEEALERHLGEQVRVTASGRTDSGVHAMEQVISFKTATTMSATAIGRGLRTHLPADITVLRCEEAATDFDARRDARLRWYRFFLCNRQARPAIAPKYLTHVRERLDLERMHAAAALLSGRHDFQAFRAVTCTATRTTLTLLPIEITQLPDNIIQVDYRCRSFLHNMVRILTGTLVAAGRGKLTHDEIRGMLETGQRHQQAVTVPPNGLFLYKVFYKGEVPEQWQAAVKDEPRSMISE